MPEILGKIAWKVADVIAYRRWEMQRASNKRVISSRDSGTERKTTRSAKGNQRKNESDRRYVQKPRGMAHTEKSGKRSRKKDCRGPSSLGGDIRG